MESLSTARMDDVSTAELDDILAAQARKHSHSLSESVRQNRKGGHHTARNVVEEDLKQRLQQMVDKFYLFFLFFFIEL